MSSRSRWPRPGAASLAAAGGADEIVLLAPPEDEGFVTRVCGAGLRARLEMSRGVLQARIVVTGVHRSREDAPVLRGERAATDR